MNSNPYLSYSHQQIWLIDYSRRALLTAAIQRKTPFDGSGRCGNIYTGRNSETSVSSVYLMYSSACVHTHNTQTHNYTPKADNHTPARVYVTFMYARAQLYTFTPPAAVSRYGHRPRRCHLHERILGLNGRHLFVGHRHQRFNSTF